MRGRGRTCRDPVEDVYAFPKGLYVFERDLNDDGRLWGERPCFAVLPRVVVACMGGLQGKVGVYNDLVRVPASLPKIDG